MSSLYRYCLFSKQRSRAGSKIVYLAKDVGHTKLIVKTNVKGHFSSFRILIARRPLFGSVRPRHMGPTVWWLVWQTLITLLGVICYGWPMTPFMMCHLYLQGPLWSMERYFSLFRARTKPTPAKRSTRLPQKIHRKKSICFSPRRSKIVLRVFLASSV